MMKVFSGFYAFLFLMAMVVALAFFNFISPTDLVATKNEYKTTSLIIGSRKLKEYESYSTSKIKGDIGHVTLQDYDPPDPVPSSKTYIKPAPIEHGTPLMPFIPRPPPPDLPSPGDYK